jgi:hypothetical protein
MILYSRQKKKKYKKGLRREEENKEKRACIKSGSFDIKEKSE